jgi:Mg2+ and Co2+ transporter CorA
MADSQIDSAGKRDSTDMRTTSIISAIMSALLGMFSWWGINSVAGQHAYDEMAGIVPYFAGLLALILAVAAIVFFWASRRSARS